MLNMSDGQLLLFDSPHADIAPALMRRHEPPEPEAPYSRTSVTSQAGARRIELSRRTVAAWIAWLLEQAGPVSSDGQRGGMTAFELARAVTRHRVVPTPVQTVLGRIGGRRVRPEMADRVAHTGLSRHDADGGPHQVWIHRRYLGQRRAD